MLYMLKPDRSLFVFRVVTKLGASPIWRDLHGGLTSIRGRYTAFNLYGQRVRKNHGGENMGTASASITERDGER